MDQAKPPATAAPSAGWCGRPLVERYKVLPVPCRGTKGEAVRDKASWTSGTIPQLPLRQARIDSCFPGVSTLQLKSWADSAASVYGELHLPWNQDKSMLQVSSSRNSRLVENSRHKTLLPVWPAWLAGPCLLSQCPDFPQGPPSLSPCGSPAIGEGSPT